MPVGANALKADSDTDSDPDDLIDYPISYLLKERSPWPQHPSAGNNAIADP
jgi:hypothetical protein